MRELEGKVAVVTGAASGMGRAFSDRFARAGMRVVLADYEAAALERAVNELKEEGFEAVGVHTDVSDPESVEALAWQTLDAYGRAHIVCNNAGVIVDSDSPVPVRGAQVRVWEHSLNDWRWTFDVNFWGVVHGIRTFVPILLEQGEPAHVVNTASMGGLTTGPAAAIYGSSKHAVVRVSEALYFQLARMHSAVKVTVLCPGDIRTRIAVAERNRQQQYREGEFVLDEAEADRLNSGQAPRPGQIEPEEVADQLLEAIRDEQFYVFTAGVTDDQLHRRFDAILERRNP